MKKYKIRQLMELEDLAEMIADAGGSANLPDGILDDILQDLLWEFPDWERKDVPGTLLLEIVSRHS